MEGWREREVEEIKIVGREKAVRARDLNLGETQCQQGEEESGFAEREDTAE